MAQRDHRPGRDSVAKDERRPLRAMAKALGFALMAAALTKELRTPVERRTWHGELLGFVPYDLRPPTLARLRAALWNPKDDRLLTPLAFGVGWSVNFARLRRMATT